MQNGTANRNFDVVRETQRKTLRDGRTARDLACDDGADARGLIGRDLFQQFDGARLYRRALAPRHVGHETRDLAGQLLAHLDVAVGVQELVGVDRRRGVGGDEAANFAVVVAGEVVKRFGRCILAACQFALGGVVVSFEHVARIFVAEPLRQHPPSQQSRQQAERHCRSLKCAQIGADAPRLNSFSPRRLTLA